MQTKDKLMSPKEVSHFLDIGDSTLRKSTRLKNVHQTSNDN